MLQWQCVTRECSFHIFFLLNFHNSFDLIFSHSPPSTPQHPLAPLPSTRLKYIADKAAQNEPSMDMGQTMFGKAGEGTISLFPFQFKYPKDYIDQSKALQPLLRIPILTSKNAADAAGVDVSGIDFSKKVCLSTLGSKMKQGGPFQKAMKAVGVTLGLVGSDFCFSLPGLDTTGKDL